MSEACRCVSLLCLTLLLVTSVLPGITVAQIELDNAEVLAKPETRLGGLAVSENGRFLVHGKDAKPWFYLADTAWELIHRLDQEETKLYLDKRQQQGFNVIQTVVLAELDGLTTPNAFGDLPLKDMDPRQPNEAYFKHVDWVIDQAERHGFYVALLPTWGDKWNKQWGAGPEIFTPENARSFGEFLGNRYRDKAILWILGGDRNPNTEKHFQIIDSLAAGLKAAHQGRQLMTYHPQGYAHSSTWFHDREWLDFNVFQSGHAQRSLPNYQFSLKDYQRKPAKPTLDLEPRYEDHPINWKVENGWFDQADVRQAAWWSILSGSCGHTYGHHSIWQMWQSGRSPISAVRTPWKEALDHPGAAQMGIMRKVMESVGFSKLHPANDWLESASEENDGYIAVARSENGARLVAYSPLGKDIVLKPDAIASGSRVRWLNPRNGEYSSIESSSKGVFTPPTKGRGNDWVLVVCPENQ